MHNNVAVLLLASIDKKTRLLHLESWSEAIIVDSYNESRFGEKQNRILSMSVCVFAVHTSKNVFVRHVC